MNALLLDLLRHRCQVKFSQSSGGPLGTWPPLAGSETKCWVHLEGHGALTDSGWQRSPEVALREAHTRALSLLGAVR